MRSLFKMNHKGKLFSVLLSIIFGIVAIFFFLGFGLPLVSHSLKINLKPVSFSSVFDSGSLLPETTQFTPFQTVIADFDAEVARGVARDSAGFVSVAVFIGNKVIWSKGYGWADIERSIPATSETIGRIGSISKCFTAVAMMQIVERGIIKLDDPIEKYFPEVNGLVDTIGVKKKITFRMLASHTAGLIREPNLPGAASGPIYLWEEKLLASIPTTYFYTQPATQYRYSNIGFGILGLACSQAAHKPFMDMVTEQIFKPFGMTSSTFIVNTPEMLERLAVGYVKDRQGRVSSEAATREHFGRGYKVPNGGIYSTVSDMAKFAAALIGETSAQILSLESRNEMMKLQPPADGYGLGLMIDEQNGIKTIYHGGSVTGYNADLRFELNSKIGVAMLRTTTYNPPTNRFLQQLVAAKKQ